MKTLLTILLSILTSTIIAQCPGSSPADFSVTDAGSPGCTADSWKHEQAVSYSGTPSGDCVILSGTTCDLSWYTTQYSLDCNFCVSYSFTLSTLTSDGIAFSFVDLSNKSSAFPCSTPFGCSEGGNLGYNNLNNTNTAGTLTIEIDVYDNSADGDDDPSCDHVSIVEDGDNNSSIAQACLPNMDDGASHTVSICWNDDTNTLTVTIDGTTYITLNQDIENYFAQTAPSEVYFAVSSGYNASFAGQNTICGITVTSTLDAENLNFSANVKNKAVELSWINLENIDAKYEILKSGDGINYELLANTQSIRDKQNYSFSDYKPFKGNNYYKIKEEIIYSGKITESSPVVVTYNNSKVNIVNYNKQLTFTTDDKLDYDIKVYNVMGSLILEKSSKGPSIVDLSYLNVGIYIVNVITDSEIISEKIYIED
jgi:hypothetical protein